MLQSPPGSLLTLLDSVIDRLLQLQDPFGNVLDFVEIMFQCGFQSGLVKMNVGFDPFQMFSGSRPSFPPFFGRDAAGICPADAVPSTGLSWPLPEPVPDPARPHARHPDPDRRQFAGSIAACQFLCIAAVGLNSISGFGRNQSRRNHLARHTQLRQLPIQYISRRARLRNRP